MITITSDGRLFIDGRKSNFFIFEFVAPEIWDRWGIRSIRYVQEAIIRGAQLLRNATGLSVTICNYKWGGSYKDSGTRILESYERMYASKSKEVQLAKYLATYSMHKFAGASDLKIGNLTSYEMADLVFDNEKELMKIGIRRIENPDMTKGRTRDWSHIDSANTGLNYILKINP